MWVARAFWLLSMAPKIFTFLCCNRPAVRPPAPRARPTQNMTRLARTCGPEQRRWRPRLACIPHHRTRQCPHRLRSRISPHRDACSLHLVHIRVVQDFQDAHVLLLQELYAYYLHSLECYIAVGMQRSRNTIDYLLDNADAFGCSYALVLFIVTNGYGESQVRTLKSCTP